MLPGKNGLEICKALRASGAGLSIIMVTARVDEIDRLLGLELGADDYICKPFSPREVVARVKAVLRRAAAPAVLAQRLALDEASHGATLDGQRLPLTPKEFALLGPLAARPGRIFSRAQLLDLLYADALDASERVLDSHVKNLRRKLAVVAPGHEWIRSVYGVGFSFEAR